MSECKFTEFYMLFLALKLVGGFTNIHQKLTKEDQIPGQPSLACSPDTFRITQLIIKCSMSQNICGDNMSNPKSTWQTYKTKVKENHAGINKDHLSPKFHLNMRVVSSEVRWLT